MQSYKISQVVPYEYDIQEMNEYDIQKVERVKRYHNQRNPIYKMNNEFDRVIILVGIGMIIFSPILGIYYLSKFTYDHFQKKE